jgi:hypothetical protein
MVNGVSIRYLIFQVNLPSSDSGCTDGAGGLGLSDLPVAPTQKPSILLPTF